MKRDFNPDIPPQIQEMINKFKNSTLLPQEKKNPFTSSQIESTPESVQVLLDKLKADRLKTLLAIANENLQTDITPSTPDIVSQKQVTFSLEDQKWLTPENKEDTAFWLTGCLDATTFQTCCYAMPPFAIAYAIPLLSPEAKERVLAWLSASKDEATKKVFEYLEILKTNNEEKSTIIEEKPLTNNTNHLLNDTSTNRDFPDYLLIETDLDLEKALASLHHTSVLGIDLETTGLDAHLHKIRLMQIAIPNQPVLIIDLAKIHNLEPIRNLLQGKAIKVGHNLKFDIKFLNKAGLNLAGSLFDTQLAHQLLSMGSKSKFSLKEIALEYLDIELDKIAQTSDWSKELSKQQLEYAAMDAAILLKLREVLKPKLIEQNLTQIAKIEFNCIHSVAEMELTGMLLDAVKWQELAQRMETNKQKEATTLKNLLKTNQNQLTFFQDKQQIDLDSPQQVLKVLQAMEIPIKSTSKREIAPLVNKYPVIQVLLNYRHWAKIVSAFGQALPKHIHPLTGRIHPNIWQLGAVSGRFSCSHPNLQQIPRTTAIRQCFIPSPGKKLIVADYSQIELRIVAEISGDKTMIKAYQQGADLHKLTASLVLDKSLQEVTSSDRQIAKSLNFGLVYGMSSKGLQNYAEVNYGVKMSEKEAENFRTKFFQNYQGLATWHKQEATEVYSRGKRETRTLANRRRLWNDKPSLNEVLNMPVQGTSADITKGALANLPTALKGTGAKVIGVVHDEIILEVVEEKAYDAARILERVMVEAGQMFLVKVPVEVEVKVCASWGDK